MEVLMSDKEILDEVYSKLNSWKDETAGAAEGNNKRIIHDKVKGITDFIEQEWQKRDEQEMVSQYNRNRNPKDWIVDVREMERHRGLEIGEDGTVKDLK